MVGPGISKPSTVSPGSESHPRPHTSSLTSGVACAAEAGPPPNLGAVLGGEKVVHIYILCIYICLYILYIIYIYIHTYNILYSPYSKYSKMIPKRLGKKGFQIQCFFILYMSVYILYSIVGICCYHDQGSGITLPTKRTNHVSH